MLSFKSYLTEEVHPIEDLEDEPLEHHVQDKIFGRNDYIPFHDDAYLMKESVENHPKNPKRLIFRSEHGGNGATGLVVPRHMWEGVKEAKAGEPNALGKPRAKSSKARMGMRDRNVLRSEVYGADHRDPLSIGQIADIHKKHLEEHFSKPKSEQIKAEKEAVERLKRAGHLDNGDTTDKGEKTDTVNVEKDEHGRSFTAVASKGVAGHALYTSGHGDNAKHHILNTCPGQTQGCGGGVDAHGVADTLKGSCFAPRAEAQYPNAAIRRACHEQAKHDPAMTRDWILAHTHSLRKRAETADKKNKRLLFRPNVLDETDRSSRHVLRHLNKQRKGEGKPSIIGNSYGKTTEQHDPENDYHVTFSNIGPKVKDGKAISENIGRDSTRVRETQDAATNAGKHYTNEDGNLTPPKNSYLVTNVKRGTDLDRQFQQHVTHAKYWGRGREEHDLSDEERSQGKEGHYDANGNLTSPDKAHYGHVTVNGRRYDYQKQHILHPRIVKMTVKKKDKKTGKTTEEIHDIASDSRFKDNEFLPKDEDRYKTRNGKNAGGILATTPVTSTPDAQHHTTFTHHVGPETIEHAKRNNGEYEIDSPYEQEKARINGEYENPHIPEKMDSPSKYPAFPFNKKTTDTKFGIDKKQEEEKPVKKKKAK